MTKTVRAAMGLADMLCTVAPTINGVTFADDATSHGMTIDADLGVKSL